jgi:hypothetical protein
MSRVCTTATRTTSVNFIVRHGTIEPLLELHAVSSQPIFHQLKSALQCHVALIFSINLGTLFTLFVLWRCLSLAFAVLAAANIGECRGHMRCGL